MAQNDHGQRDAETFQIIGAAMEVHRQLGCGFLERIYTASFAIELALRQIPFRREVKLPVLYKGRRLPLSYIVDFLCFDAVVVEVKALAALGPVEQSQAINYLRASGLTRALLLNFGGRSLQWRRMVHEHPSAARITVATFASGHAPSRIFE